MAAIQVAFYKFLLEHIQISPDGKENRSAMTLSFLENRLNGKGYTKQKLLKQSTPNFEIRLFYKEAFTPARWKGFIKTIAASSAPICTPKKSLKESYVLLVKIKGKKSIYAACGGQGHIAIQDLIDNSFGLDVLCRLVTLKDKVLKSSKERNVAGGLTGSVKYFRGNYNLHENENFGNFYNELNAKLTNTILEESFGFAAGELKDGSFCIAKNSFLIKKSISYDRLLKIINCCEKILLEKVKASINSVRKLDRYDRTLISVLNQQLLVEVFAAINPMNNEKRIEICHRDFDKYMEGDSYKVDCRLEKKVKSESLSSLYGFEDILDVVPEIKSISDRMEFEKVLSTMTITSCDSDGNALTTGSFLDHCCMELVYDDCSYFHFNREWYRVQNKFIQLLNQHCKDFISTNTFKLLLKDWNSSKIDENEYNTLYLNTPNTLVLDKICPDNVEVCDILRWDNDNVYFIHVKTGFDNQMRILTRQVQIAARIIQEDLKTKEKKFLTALYKELKDIQAQNSYFKKVQAQTNALPLSKFLKLFEGKKPIFVLAVHDSSASRRKIVDIEKFQSNIAKFCLADLAQTMRLLNVDFQIAQISLP